MTEEIGEELGASIEHVIRVEVEANGRAWGRCLRVRIAVDLHKLLLRGKWLMSNDQKYWISFKYERLQSFCFHCGVLFHKGKSCSRPRYGIQAEEKQPQYGPWLRAQPMNTSIFDNRKYGGTQTTEEHRKQKPAANGKSEAENTMNQEKYRGEWNRVGVEEVYGRNEDLGPGDDTKTATATLKKLDEENSNHEAIDKLLSQEGVFKRQDQKVDDMMGINDKVKNK